MKTPKQRLDEMRANPQDKRHGSTYGYRLGCRCDHCQKAAQDYLRKYRLDKKPPVIPVQGAVSASNVPISQKWCSYPIKAKTRLKKAKKRQDFCTLNEYDKQLMRAPSMRAPYCLVCGRTDSLEQHHIVYRSAGEWVENGVKKPKPTITLCGFGNNLYDDHGRMYCHGAVHHGLLHFRYVPVPNITSAKLSQKKALPDGAYGGGHLEYLRTVQPTKTDKALAIVDGWRKIGGTNGD